MSSTVSNGQRVKLHKLVNKLVDKWSLDYVQQAKNGDFEAMLKVADIQFSKKGWGKIAHNPYQGRRWVEFAASRGDPYALYTLKNLVIADSVRVDKLAQLQRHAINNNQHPRQWRHLYEMFTWYYRGFNPRRLTNMHGQPNQQGPFTQTKIGSAFPTKQEIDKAVQQNHLTPSMKLRNGEPEARYRFPAVYSKNDVFRAIKASLDGKMQHRPTDPIPRPVHEYIHNGNIPAPSHTPLIELAVGIVESGTFDAGETGTWKDVKSLEDGDGAVLSGEQLTFLTEAMDKMDRYNQPYPLDQLEDYELTMKGFLNNAGTPATKAAFAKELAGDKDKANEEIGLTTIEVFQKRYDEELQKKSKKAVTTDSQVDLTDIKNVINKLKYLDENDGDVFAEHNLAPFRDLYKGLPDLYGDEVLSDGPYEDHVDAHNFSDIERLWYEWPHPDEKRTLPFGIGMLYHQDHRFPYRAEPSFNYFMGDPQKAAHDHSSYLDYDDLDDDGELRESSLVFAEETVAPAIVHQIADLIDMTNGTDPKGVDPKVYKKLQSAITAHLNAVKAYEDLDPAAIAKAENIDDSEASDSVAEFSEDVEGEIDEELEDELSESDISESEMEHGPLSESREIDLLDQTYALFGSENQLSTHSIEPLIVPVEEAKQLLATIRLLDPGLYADAKTLAAERTQVVMESDSEADVEAEDVKELLEADEEAKNARSEN